MAKVCFILSWVFLVSINFIKASNSNLYKSSSVSVLSIVVSPPLNTYANSLPTSIPWSRITLSLYNFSKRLIIFSLTPFRERLKVNLYSELKLYVIDVQKEKKIQYPINQYPEKIKSINFEKVNEYEGILTGIKGQYIYIDNQYVVNMRKYTGYYFNIYIQG